MVLISRYLTRCFLRFNLQSSNSFWLKSTENGINQLISFRAAVFSIFTFNVNSAVTAYYLNYTSTVYSENMSKDHVALTLFT